VSAAEVSAEVESASEVESAEASEWAAAASVELVSAEVAQAA
jgi:hypothetical protein